MAATALLGCTPVGTPNPDQPQATTGTISRSDQAQASVSAFFNSARSGDRAAFQQTLSPRDPAFADRARLLFDNLRGLPLTGLTSRLVPGEHPVSAGRQQLLGGDAWAQQFAVTWQLADDVRPAEQIVWLTLAAQDGQVQVAGTIDVPAGSSTTRQPVWWLGPVSAAQLPNGTVLLGSGQPEATWSGVVQRAAEAVSRHLPSTVSDVTERRLVVEVPATSADFEAVVGAASGTYSEIAAVTLSEGPTPRSALRVVVNPAAARRLSTEGLAVTLAHEAVHTATRSPESAAPAWAVEGLADYVALVAYPDARAAVARPLLVKVKGSGPPRALPADAAFAADAAQLDLAYAEAWSFCRYLAESSSPAQLGRLYRELNRGRTLDQAANDVLRRRGSELTAGWRRWLQDQADGG